MSLRPLPYESLMPSLHDAARDVAASLATKSVLARCTTLDGRSGG